MFPPHKVILKSSEKTDPRVVYVSLHCGIPDAFKFLLEKCKIHKLLYAVLYINKVLCYRPACCIYML